MIFNGSKWFLINAYIVIEFYELCMLLEWLIMINNDFEWFLIILNDS
jgi:hypothetical protein